MLLAAAFVSYAGPFTAKFRAQLLTTWLKFLNDRQAPISITDPLKVTGWGRFSLFLSPAVWAAMPGRGCLKASN